MNSSPWDAKAVRDDLVAYVREHLADPQLFELYRDSTSKWQWVLDQVLD